MTDIEKVHRIVCEMLNVDYESTFVRSRKRELVEARQLTFYLCSTYKMESLGAIGSFFYCENNRKAYDHATVLNGKKVVNNLKDTNHSTKNGINYSLFIKIAWDRFLSLTCSKEIFNGDFDKKLLLKAILGIELK